MELIRRGVQDSIQRMRVMSEANHGSRDERGHYRPNKRIGYPPVFVWPPRPLPALKWMFALPGYFVPWNLFYVAVGVLAWFLLSPPLEAYATPNPVTILLAFLRNSALVALYFGAFHMRLYRQKAQGTDYKFNPRWPVENSKKFMFGNQNLDNAFLTFASGVTIWTAFEVGILWLAANGVVAVIDARENLTYIIAVLLLIHLWRDLHFYVIHRLIHVKPLYAIAHKVHHKNINPGPWSGLAMHPIEHLFYFSCALLFLALPFHPVFVIVALVHAGLSPAPGHAGFERVRVGKNDQSVDIDSYAHYLHHKHFECNYADGILPLDRWFGTLHDGSEEAQQRLRNRLKEKTRQ